MRCFIGLPVPDGIADQLLRAARPLRRDSQLPVSRWSHPADYHITLAFLGQIAPERLPDLLDAMAESSASISPFALTIDQLAGFPGNRPVVLAAIPHAHTGLALLQRRLVDALDNRGLRLEDRRFHAHLSLARLRGHPRGLTLPPLEPVHLPVHDIALYSSDPGLQGPRYSVLGRAELVGGINSPL